MITMTLSFQSNWRRFNHQNTTKNVFSSQMMAEWLRRLTGNLRVPSSIPGSNSLCSCQSLQRGGAVAMETELIGAKLTVEAQLVIAENTISVGHCVFP